MKKTILIIGPARSGKTTTALKIAEGHRRFVADQEQVFKHNIRIAPAGTEVLIIEGADALLTRAESFMTLIRRSEFRSLGTWYAAPEIVVTSQFKREELPDYLIMNERITLIDLWQETTRPQIL